MSIPKQPQIREAISKYLLGRRGGTASNADVIPALERMFGITEADKQVLEPSRRQHKWPHIVHNSVSVMRRQGVLESVERAGRGVWSILPKGLTGIDVVTPPPPPPPLPPLPNVHADLVKKIEEIGKRLNFLVDIRQSNVPYRHDGLWNVSLYQPPRFVWEMCDKGMVDKDMVSLQWAVDPRNWGAKGILVTVADDDYNKAIRVLGPRQDIIVLKAEWVKQLHALTTESAIMALLRALFA